jgi:hypothetical protein
VQQSGTLAAFELDFVAENPTATRPKRARPVRRICSFFMMITNMVIV